MLIAGTDGKIQRPVRAPEDSNKTIRMLCFTPAVLADEEVAPKKEPENTAQGAIS